MRLLISSHLARSQVIAYYWSSLSTDGSLPLCNTPFGLKLLNPLYEIGRQKN